MPRPSSWQRKIVGQRLATARLNAGHSHDSLAKAMRKTQLAQGAQRTTGDIKASIPGHESGRHWPTAEYRLMWARALQQPVEDLFALPDDNSANQQVSPQPDAPSSTPPILGATPTSELEDAEMRRRAALQVITAAATGAMIPPGVLEKILAGAHGPGSLDLDSWDETVYEYGLALVERPAGALIPELVAELTTIGDIMSRPLSEAQTAGMMRAAAGLTGLLAIDLGDHGDVPASRRSWQAAIKAADRSGDDELRVWARGRAAEDGVWLNRPGQIIAKLTAQALEISKGRPFPGTARIHSARALLASHQGRPEDAQKEIDHLKRVCEKIPSLDGNQTPLAYRSTQMLFAETFTRALAGSPTAENAIDGTRALYPEHALAPRTNLDLMGSLLMVRHHDYGTALSHATAALQAPNSKQSAGSAYLIGRILREIPPELRMADTATHLRALSSVPSL